MPIAPPAFARPAGNAAAAFKPQNPAKPGPQATMPAASHAPVASHQVTQPSVQVTQPAAAPPPPVPAGACRAKALYSHSGQSATELSFKVDDIIIIHRKDAGGWWEGELNGTRGWVPNNYVKEI